MSLSEQEIKEIIECMAVNDDLAFQIQSVQTRHRVKLVEFWGIPCGSRILEIGCGQGDTTAVLAYYAGEEGFVHGIDVAPPSYGSPVTLGESAGQLVNSKLGKQIQIDFNVDPLSSEVEFEESSFDYIVFSHCSWYTKSKEELLAILSKVRKWGKHLCFAEWSTTITSIEQFPHLLAVLIQAQYEAFKQVSESNVRTLLTPQDIRDVTESAGWRILQDQTMVSPDLQDGRWEVDKVLNEFDTEMTAIKEMPLKMENLLYSQVAMLKSVSETGVISPLPVYCLVAE